VNEGGTVNIKAARTMTIRILAMVDDLFNAVMGRQRFRQKDLRFGHDDLQLITHRTAGSPYSDERMWESNPPGHMDSARDRTFTSLLVH